MEETAVTFFMARQALGKTTLLRHRREANDAAGTPFPIINLETNKPGIRKFVTADVHTLPPTALSAAAMHKFVFETVTMLVERGARHIVVDTNGEDIRLLQMCRSYPLAPIFKEVGVKAQLFYIGGADVENLKFLQTIHKSGSFEGATVLLGFAQHSSQASDPSEAYNAFKDSALIRSISALGKENRKVLIPQCAELEDIQHVVAPLHEIGVVAGYPPDAPPVSPWVRHRIGSFCRELDQALAPILGVIP